MTDVSIRKCSARIDPDRAVILICESRNADRSIWAGNHSIMAVYITVLVFIIGWPTHVDWVFYRPLVANTSIKPCIVDRFSVATACSNVVNTLLTMSSAGATAATLDMDYSVI